MPSWLSFKTSGLSLLIRAGKIIPLVKRSPSLLLLAMTHAIWSITKMFHHFISTAFPLGNLKRQNHHENIFRFQRSNSSEKVMNFIPKRHRKYSMHPTLQASNLQHHQLHMLHLPWIWGCNSSWRTSFNRQVVPWHTHAGPWKSNEKSMPIPDGENRWKGHGGKNHQSPPKTCTFTQAFLDLAHATMTGFTPTMGMGLAGLQGCHPHRDRRGGWGIGETHTVHTHHAWS